ncbi:MAG: PAS domain S-box protein [Hymenobacteraceae bacterium]|nr:PAS domain S-box protein [Hymenobacteraceae bacterium]
MEQNKNTRSANSHRRTMRYIGTSFISIVVVLIAVCLFSYIRANLVQQEYGTKMLHAYQRLELVNTLFSNKELAQDLLREHIYTQDSTRKESLREKLAQAHTLNNTTIQKLDRLLQNQDQKALLASLVAERKAYYVHADSLLRLSDQNLLAEAQAYSRAHLGPFYSRHQALLLDLSESATDFSQKQADEALAVFSSTVNESVALFLFALLSIAGTAFTLRKVYRNLHKENALLNAEIQERTELQKALLRSQYQYKSLFNSNPVPMWIYDPNTYKILKVNRAAEQEYGYKKAEFLRKTVLDLRTLEDAERILSMTFPLDEESAFNETWHRRKNGSLFRVEVRSHSLPKEGSICPRLVVAVNVEEQIRASDKLKQNEKQLREVSSSIPGAVYQFQVDEQRKITFPFVSEGIKELYGVTPDEVYDNPDLLFEGIHPDDLELIRETTEQSNKGLTPWLVEYRLRSTHLNKWKWVRGHGLPTLKKDGSILYNGTLIDITDQKEAQQQLSTKEAKLRALLNSSPQAIYLLGQEMEVLSFNAVAAAEVKSCRLQDLVVGQSLLDYVDEVQRATFCEHHARALQGETVMYQTGQGNQWFEVAFRPVVTAENKTISVALSIHNISEQKKAIESIKRSELQLSHAHRIAKLGSWEYDFKGDLLTMSGTLFTIYGLPNDFRPTFQNVLARFHPDDRDAALAKFNEAVAAKRSVLSEHRVLLDDGTEKYLHHVIEPLCDTAGEVIKIQGTTQDITDLRKKEQEAIEAKNLFQSTIENIQEAILTADPDLTITYISPQCLKVSGYTEEVFLGKSAHWIQKIHPDDRCRLMNEILPKVVAGEPQQYELRIMDPGNNTRWLLLRASPKQDAQGKVVRIDCSAADMTQYKAAEANRAELIEQLLIQNQNLQQFTYIVSHNLRAPIANILGLTNVYNRKQPEALINQRVVDGLLKSAKLLDTTIRDLNEILSIRSRIHETQETVMFEELVNDILSSISEDVAQADATVSCDFSGAPSITSLRGYVLSIVQNLLINAIKYRSPERKLHLSLSTFCVSDYICLQVCDNGLGIDLAKEKDKIFGLYKRFHHTIEGKGLGLHLVKTQAELLGGKVEVESQVDVGTTFSVYFKS